MSGASRAAKARVILQLEGRRICGRGSLMVQSAWVVIKNFFNLVSGRWATMLSIKINKTARDEVLYRGARWYAIQYVHGHDLRVCVCVC